MTRLYLRALKTLPDDYVRDGTQTCEICENAVVAVHPDLPPILWREEAGWEELSVGPPPPEESLAPFLAGVAFHRNHIGQSD